MRSTVSSNSAKVSASSRSPRCGESTALLPRARQTVALCAAPTARIAVSRGAGTGSANASGTKPRARRTGTTWPHITRTTESSARVWMLRS